MSEISQRGGVTRNSALPLRNQGCAVGDSIAKFARPVMSVDAFADPIRGIEIAKRRCSNRTAIN
jgi:hypothetical protein